VTQEKDAQNDHPDWQEIIFDGRDGVNDSGHVPKHSDQSSHRPEDNHEGERTANQEAPTRTIVTLRMCNLPHNSESHRHR